MLSYIIWDVNPELFSIGTFSVRWYGLLFALGFLLGQQIMLYIFKREGKPIADIDALTLYMVIATVLGARIGHFLFYEPEVLFKNPLEVILPPYRGLASHGATVGILTGLWLYSRRKSSRATNQTFLWVTDRIVIAVALGGCFIRLGNLMNSEIVGRPTDVPWGFVFVNNTEYLQIPRHPAQLYEAISCFFICLFLFWFWNRYKQNTPHGSLLGIFLIGVFGLRFVYEYFKENQVEFENTLALNMGQILSIPAVLAGIYLLIVSFRKRPTPIDSSKSR
ncbi:prolipoprotein diacylglyceryl transferase [Larkinella rosea]|uniref:Phosphatidylglycerol--prolipoprotein diacylglyceryl transferase n=1 Tax=Larkinella rosea TaxID=2025312 RepID=A0A3P1B9P5_9BACT|nr:prolipoprotein diacylglyceryl transferase [Larkinella rosea]RRA97709.1 prolipoprotein diacylglyceryl transferase [Larkinella rosea]